MRWKGTALAWGIAWGAASADGHGLPFQFRADAGAQRLSGPVELAWTDADLAGGYAVSVHLSPKAYPPNQTEPLTLALEAAAAIDYADPTNAVRWDPRGAPGGCYHPYALLHFPGGAALFEPSTLAFVFQADAGAALPLVRFETAMATVAPDAGGQLGLTLEVGSGEPVVLDLEAVRVGGGTTRLSSQGLVGGADALREAEVNLAGLSDGLYFLRAEVEDRLGQRCDAFWNGVVLWQHGADGGGRADAPRAAWPSADDLPAQGELDEPRPTASGCTSGPRPPFASAACCLLALVLLNNTSKLKRRK